MPAPPWPPVGVTFTGHGDRGNFTVDVSGRITGSRSVTLADGTAVAAVVIDSSITTHGQVESSVTETDWFAPSLRLSVHTETRGGGTYGFVSYRTDMTADLESARPA